MPIVLKHIAALNAHAPLKSPAARHAASPQPVHISACISVRTTSSHIAVLLSTHIYGLESRQTTARA